VFHPAGTISASADAATIARFQFISSASKAK